MPKRIQRRRTAGWRKPPNTIVVTRPGPWGNPFKVGDPGVPDREAAAARLAVLIKMRAAGFPLDSLPAYPTLAEIRSELAGRNLACWCGPGACHADVLLAIANGYDH